MSFEIKRAALVGAGAVGSTIASRLYKRYGDDFSIIAKGERASRLAGGLCVNQEVFYPRIISGDVECDKPDLILVCVKNYALEQTIEDIRPLVGEHTLILSLLNGVSAVPRLIEEFGESRVLYGIVMRTDADRLKRSVTYTTMGEIQFGYEKNEPISPEVAAVQEYFDAADVTNKVYPDMKRMLWRKWLVNVGANQVSLLTAAKFKYFGMIPEISDLMRIAMDEILLLAQHEKVNLTVEDRDAMIRVLINYPPEKKTSMLQDLEARRKTEIDCFAGTVMKYGREWGIPTPVNEAMYYAIKSREKVYLSQKAEEEEAAKGWTR